MTYIEHLTIEAADAQAAEDFYTAAFGSDLPLRFRASEEPTSGFRGFTLDLVAAQPANVDLLFDAALAAGAETVKAPVKSLWGYGGVLRTPDGVVMKLVTSSKKDTEPAERKYDEVVLLMGTTDMKAAKKFYEANGLEVAKSYGGKYTEFATDKGAVKLALYPRKAFAKTAFVDPAGSGSHRIAIGGSGGSFTDPDGFVWEGTGA
ncbi:VOC family protein [Glycomyces terrestris]|uniref:Glyoxalase n=1 Tax=Glycomyces terrestris TaxID=2493553 RepID=A0A426V0R5_9ACTN|nr:glyoxalase [Glycomyces terrestris]RRS00454.1 glyoxalase [Glycomyces terrestris]